MHERGRVCLPLRPSASGSVGSTLSKATLLRLPESVNKQTNKQTNTHTRETRQGSFIHGFFIFTAPSAPLFAGIVGLPMSMSVAVSRTRAATCRKHTDSKQGTAQHEDEQHGSLLRPEQPKLS